MTTPTIVDGSEPPAPSLDALLALLPQWAADGDADLRDALLYAWGEMANALATGTTYFLGAQQTPRWASGAWLDWWGAILKRPRIASSGTSESDDDYRARLLGPIDLISPVAVKAAIEALFAAGSPAHWRYVEPAEDAVFLAPTASPPTWAAWMQPDANTTENISVTQSHKRLLAYYPDQPAAIGAYFTSGVRRAEFWIIGDGTESDLVFDQVVAEVEAKRGGGVVWMFFDDSLLPTAV